MSDIPYRFLPNAGVGRARMEFIVTEYVQAHPMALLHPERVTEAREREAVAQLTRRLLQLAVEGCKRNGRHSAICGEAPSDYPVTTLKRIAPLEKNLEAPEPEAGAVKRAVGA